MASRNLFVNIIGVDKASGKFGKVGKAVGLLAAPAIAAGGALFAMGTQFDKARDAIIVGTGASGKALKGLQGDFRAVASTTAANFEDVGTAIADVNTRLGLTGKPLRDVSKKFLDLSRITKTDLGENIESVTRLFGDWSIKTKDQSATLDKLFKTSQATGIGVSDLSRLMVQFGSPLRQLGLDFDFSAAMFARFEKEGVNIQTAMPGLRMALKNFAKAGKDPAKALMSTFDAIKNAGSAAKANTLAFKIFGVRAGPDMAAAIREGRFDLDALMKTMRDSKGALADASKRTESFGEKWLKVKNKVFLALEGPATKVFDGVAAGMDKLGVAFSAMMGAFREGDVTSDGFVGAAERLGVTLRQIGQVLRNQVIPAFKAIFGWMRRNQGLVKTLAIAIGALVVVTKLHAAALKVQAAGGVLSFLASYLKSIKVVQVVTKAWTAVQWLLNAAMAANPITLIILALVALGVALFIAYKKSETFRNIVDKVFKAVGAVISWWWNNIVKPYFAAVMKAIKIVGKVFTWLYKNAVKPAISLIVGAFKVWLFFANLVFMGVRKLIEKVIAPAFRWIYRSVIKPVINLIVKSMKGWARVFQWLWRSVIKPVWNFISRLIRSNYNRLIRPPLSALIRLIKTTVPSAFRSGVNTIKRWWDRLKNIAKRPINFIIGTVVNRGIIGTLNKIARWLGVKQRLGKVRTLAHGGVMPGYRPGVDTIPAMLSPGEGVLRPEVVRALGPSQIDAWNAAARTGQRIEHFASGGIAGLLRGPASWFRSKLSGPINRIKERFGNSFFTRAATALPRKLVGFAIEKVKKWVASWFGGGGGKNLGSSPGGSVAAIVNMARRFQSNVRLTSGYRRGDPGWHGRGLAADLVGGGASGMARIARGFYRMSGRLIELIHSGGGGFFVKNGRRVGRGYYGREIANHYNHVHVAARRDALANMLPRNVFDRGGYLPRGASVAVNNTGSPERVVPPGGDDPKRWAREFVKELKNQGMVGVFRDPDRVLGRRADLLIRG